LVVIIFKNSKFFQVDVNGIKIIYNMIISVVFTLSVAVSLYEFCFNELCWIFFALYYFGSLTMINGIYFEVKIHKFN